MGIDCKSPPHQNCLVCPLRDSPGPLVWGQGPPTAKLVAIGQCPGETEIKEKTPFVGGSGTVLDMTLAKVGGSRERTFVTNVVKCYVKPGTSVPSKAVECCRPLLDHELKLMKNPYTTLTLGAEAFAASTGKRLLVRHNRQGAEKDSRAWLRGAIYHAGYEKPTNGACPSVIVPTIHPAFVMRAGFAPVFEFEADVRRAVEVASGVRSLPQETQYDNPTDSDVSDYVDELLAAGEGGIDIETPEADVDDDDLDPTTRIPIYLVGLSSKVGESISIRAHQFQLLEPLLDRPLERKVTLWAHNGAAFDFPHLRNYFSLEGIRQADSMLAFYLLWSHLTNFDLATAMSLTIDMPYYKNWRKLQPELYDTLGNCRDTYGCLWVGQECMRQLASKPIDMRPLFWEKMMELQPLVEDWYRTGVRVDEDEANRQALLLLSQLKVLEDFWRKSFPLVDWESPKQLIQLFTAMKLPLVMKERIRKDKTRYKSPSVDDDALEDYVTKHKCQTAKLVQLMRGLNRGARLATSHENGRLHPKLKLTAQVGGRIQSSGDNIQNTPEELPLFPSVRPRKMIVGDTSDHVVICADFSQIEFREYVWYAKAKNLKAVLDSGHYIYGILYEQLFNEVFFKPGGRSKRDKRDDIPAWKLLLAKTYPMGFIYGRQPKDGLGARLYSEFHTANPEISAFHTRLFLQVSRDRFYQSVFGRMRRFANPKAQKNEIYSCPGQLTAVDILNQNALLPLKKLLPAYGARIMFPQYDSVEISVPKSKAEEVGQLVKSCMETPIPQMEGLVIPAEIHIGPSWDTK